jgi:DNA-binding SARP family transcriptional activator/tetratricopeptide (TPR) repeat protein
VASGSAEASGKAGVGDGTRDRGQGTVFWVGVLGPLLVRSDGEPVPVPAPKQRVILAALALRAGQVASYDELAEIVWDGAPPSGARVAIRNYVKRLRQILGPVAGRRIITRDPGYALEAEPDEVDALRFTALCSQGGEAIRGDTSPGRGAWELLGEAIGLWRGNPLVDVPSNVLITAEVPRLDALRMQAQEWRMDAGLALGLHAELVGELTQLAHDHPWRERFHAQLMLALYRCGRQAEALAAYQRTRRMLVDELGVEPGRELRDLQAGILDAAPDLAAPGPALARFLTAPPAPGPVPPAGRANAGQAPGGTQAPATLQRRTPAGRTPAGRAPGGRAPGGSVSARHAAGAPARPVTGGTVAGSGAPGSEAPGTGAPGARPGVARTGTGRAQPPAGAAAAEGKATVGAGPSRPAQPGTAAGRAAVVPRQLPAGVAHFAGRIAELAELQTWQHEAASADGAAKVLVIGGTAGAGKTALAVHWAQQSAGEFPDGQLYVNLRGFDPSGTPVTPGDALRWFLGAFGITEEQMPDSVEEQSALYRSVLAGKRVLVILDNARDAAQVRPLLPGSRSCLALVTSRARLPGLAATEGARLVPLDVLTADEAHELLASRLGERASAEADAAQQLTEACSRLPLALSIVAARVAARPYLPLADLARELADAQGRLDALDAGDPVASIRAVFSWSCEQLSGPAAQMFRLLGLHAGPDVTIAAAASLAGVGRGPATAAVAELADAHLIAEHAPGRYAFHDLLRAYAAYLARTTDSDAERREAVQRVLDYYLYTASAGSRVLNPVRPLITLEPPRPGVVPELLSYASETLAWFEAERHVLIAAIAQASDGGFDQHAWQLPWAAWLFFDRAGYWHDQVAIQRTAVDAAGRLGDQARQAHAYRDLGAAVGRLGQLTEARDYCRRALGLHRQVGDRLGEARAHNEIAMLAEQQGRIAEALGHAQLALNLYRQEGHEQGLAKMLNGVGWMHAQLGDYELALEFCEQALGMYQGRGDPLNEAATWDSMGYVLMHLGRLDEAIGCLRTALNIIYGLRTGYYETTMLVHLGDAYHATGDEGLARQSWQDALAILEGLNHSDADQVRARLQGVEPPGAGVPAASAEAALGSRLRADQAVGA